ncbi:ankyrin repeat-containing domain protein [Bipolaris maydis]|nr:ankyrin repeat-containing domain protein [Bipolaris maydis]
MESEVFKCDICSKLCGSLRNFNRHQKTHEKPFRCEACPSGFALRSDLDRHVRARHRVGNDQYRCHVSQCRHTRKYHSGALLPVEKPCTPSTIEAVVVVSASQTDEISPTNDLSNGIYSVSLFMRAAASGDIPALELLMNCGYTTDTRADDQSTALHCAARSGQARTVQYLLERGASCEAWNDKYRTPLHEAILSSDSDTVKVLIQHKSEDYRTYLSSHPLRYVAKTRNIEIMELYLENQGTEIKAANANLMFRYALQANNDTLVAALLVRPDIDVNRKDYNGRAPLHYAAQRSNAKTMSLMLASDRIDTSSTAEWRMLTIIHIAARYGNIEVVKQLLRKDDKAVSFRDREGKTPLYYAAFKRHWEVVHLLLQHASCVNHCDPTSKPPENGEFVKKDTVSALLNHSDFGDPNLVGPAFSDGPLLHCAARSGDDEAVTVLLAHENTDVNQTNGFCENPLMAAAEHGHIEVVRLLLQHPKIDVDIKDRSHLTPLRIARLNSHQEIVDLLLSYGAIDDEEANLSTTTMETSGTPMTQDTTHTHDMDLQELDTDPDFDVEGFIEGMPDWKGFSEGEDEMVE